MTDYTATMNDPVYGRCQTVTYTGTAGTSSAITKGITTVVVWCSTAAHIKVGVSATATVDVDMAIPAGVVVPLPVKVEGSRVSAVQVTGGSGGSLYVTEVSN